MNKDISYERNPEGLTTLLDFKEDQLVRLYEIEFTLQTLQKPNSNSIFLESELKVLLELVQLTRAKYCIAKNIKTYTIPQEITPLNPGELIDAWAKFYWDKDLEEVDPYEKIGLIKLVTSSKRIEQHYYHICKAVKKRIIEAAQAAQPEPKPVVNKTARELRELKIERWAKVLGIANGVAVGLMLAGTFIAVNVIFFGLPALTAFGISIIFLTLGGTVSARMGMKSLPEILKKVIGREKRFDGLQDADESIEDISHKHRKLSPRQKIMLKVGFVFATCTGLLTSAFSFSSITGFFATLMAVAPFMAATGPGFLGFAIALWLVNAASVLLIMYRSIYQLISIPDLFHRFTKAFLQLWDPDAACHREQNKSALRVYVEAVLICLIVPLAMLGLIATVMGFIPGLSQLAAKIIPHAPIAIIDIISSTIGFIAALGELPFNLKTIFIGVEKSAQTVADYWRELKSIFNKKPHNVEDQLPFKERAKNAAIAVGNVLLAVGVLVAIFTYSVGQGFIALTGGLVFGRTFAWITGGSATNTAFCEADEGAEIGETSYTLAITKFNKDIIGRADRIEEKHENEFNAKEEAKIKEQEKQKEKEKEKNTKTNAVVEKPEEVKPEIESESKNTAKVYQSLYYRPKAVDVKADSKPVSIKEFMQEFPAPQVNCQP